MGYSHVLYDKSKLSVEYSRFTIKLVFSVIIILLLAFIGFFYTFITLICLLIISSLFYKYFSNSDNKLIQFIFSLEREYGNSIAGKETNLVLLAMNATFATIFILNYLIDFSLEWALIFGFMVWGIGTNFSSMILYFKKIQFVIHGTTIEFFIVCSVVNFLILWFFGLPWLAALFISISLNLILIMPWVDHNLLTILATSVLYVLLFI